MQTVQRWNNNYTRVDDDDDEGLMKMTEFSPGNTKQQEKSSHIHYPPPNSSPPFRWSLLCYTPFQTLQTLERYGAMLGAVAVDSKKTF